MNNILKRVEVPVEDPRFSQAVFREIAKEQEDESGLQEGCSIRNILRTRHLSEVLINNDGKLNETLVPKVIADLTTQLYSLGPERQYDAKRQEQILRVLKMLQENKKVVRALMRISKPAMHKYADQMIRDTLDLPPKTVITDAHARRAALSAWMCYLRQNVGSCFATAPAIIVHDEQPEAFLNDLQELLSTGRLKRTFGGIEYAVPLSTSWGAGDLKRKVAASVEIWKSPGLKRALDAVGLKDYEQLDLKNVYFISAEEIIRALLLQKFKLTEKDLEEYELRPKGMIRGGILMTPPGASGGKGKVCEEFLNEFEIAKNAFKSFADNALLKAWEFSLASFAETKSQFTRWNLYSSLGLGPKEPGGIGQCLFEILQRKLDECNLRVKEHQEEYEQLYTQVQYLQRRIQRASSEQEAQWIRVEYQTKANEFNLQEELRNKFHNKARRYANLFDGLIDLYDRLFPRYFQEVYDADIIDVAAGPYDDSPAGFRLLYKHGRSNTAQWSKINNHTEFIDALASFFTATETEIAGSPEMNGLEDDISEIITAIVNHVRSKEFIETAFHRMAQAHNVPPVKDPLENLDKIQKKPWVYTSGGAMTTLVSCYFKREEKPTEVSRWVENPMELLTFFVDCVKEIPESSLNLFEENPERSLLAHSPTHAFLLKPGYSPFKEAWKSREFSYSWLRDNLVDPMKRFCEEMYLDADKMQFLVEELRKKVPENFKPCFKEVFGGLRGSLSVRDFRHHLVDTMEITPGLQYRKQPVLLTEEIDSTLYSLLPIIPNYKLEEQVEQILEKLPGIEEIKPQIIKLLQEISGKIGAPKLISSKGLKEIIQSLISLVTESHTTPYDYPLLISQTAQKLGYAFPAPIIFADTNWVKDHFAFVVNPGTTELEFWRMDYTGSVGAPMKIWTHWLNGTRKDPQWGVYTHPHEYRL